MRRGGVASSDRARRPAASGAPRGRSRPAVPRRRRRVPCSRSGAAGGPDRVRVVPLARGGGASRVGRATSSARGVCVDGSASPARRGPRGTRRSRGGPRLPRPPRHRGRSRSCRGRLPRQARTGLVRPSGPRRRFDRGSRSATRAPTRRLGEWIDAIRRRGGRAARPPSRGSGCAARPSPGRGGKTGSRPSASGAAGTGRS